MPWRKANSCSERRFLFWVSFNTQSLALKTVTPGKGDICSSRETIFPTHQRKTLRKFSGLIIYFWPRMTRQAS